MIEQRSSCLTKDRRGRPGRERSDGLTGRAKGERPDTSAREMIYLSETSAILGLLLTVVATLLVLLLILPCAVFWRVSDWWRGVESSVSSSDPDAADEI